MLKNQFFNITVERKMQGSRDEENEWFMVGIRGLHSDFHPEPS